jgi:flagellar hook-associated protein 3 FlgL
MLHYNVNTTSASGSLGADAVSKVDASLVNGSSYAINITGFASGSVNYDITETPTPTSPATAAPASGSATWSATQGFTIAEMPGLSLHVTGTPTIGDSLSVDASGSIFGTLDKAVNDLTAATTSTAANQAVSQALKNIDLSMARISAVRGQAGDLLNRADSITSTNDKRTIEQKANQSRAEDVDMIQAVSEFQKQQTGYQAALQSYAMIQKLSLFNYVS